ncbi:TPA: hypothetical protein G8O67_005416 [Salmonella enterica]|uniref:Uncharacterized protein n=1 Tax=Salmonella enterica TaxID=28901 RepID=A0A756IA14_SALER|nr:hypothetical protein [Salmonella enterica subsp. enterica serovar Typhimurium]HAG0017995.1 hypothetical protein [Salmonella enterica]
MSNSIELTRIYEWLKEHDERITAHQYVIQSLLAMLPQHKLVEAKKLLRNSLEINKYDRQKINDEAWLERHNGVLRELPHLIPTLFDYE